MTIDKRFPRPYNTHADRTGELGVLIAIPLMALGIAIGLQSQNSTLSCNRTSPTQVECRLLQANILGTLLGRQRSEVDLGIVKSAEVMVELNANGETYKVMLLTDRGKQELTDSMAVADPEGLVNRINDFILDRQEKTLELQEDERWFSSAFGGILVLTGLWKIFTFNKSKPQPLPFPR